jgi:predicted RNA-binding Zn-ribbon protein involved in translation (DUF1610 family)
VEKQWEPKYPEVEAWSAQVAGFVVTLGRADMTYAHNGVWVPFRVVIPAWFVLMVLLLTCYGLRRRTRMLLRLERAAAGLCGECGYDLRATPHKCPECGTQAKRATVRGIARRFRGPAGRVGAAPFWWVPVCPAGH